MHLLFKLMTLYVLICLIAWAPVDVLERQLCLDTEHNVLYYQNIVVHTCVWSAILAYTGVDYCFMWDTGVAFPGNWPFKGAWRVYETLGISYF